MRATFEQISDHTELKAAAAAAWVLGARLKRLDVPPAQGMRDFDLVFSDGTREPLEITRHVDQAALETWERLARASPFIAPTLRRRWLVRVPPVSFTTKGRRPYDVNDFKARIETALAAVEAAGHKTISLGRIQLDRSLGHAFQTLVDLAIQDGVSRELQGGQPASISLMATVGGVTQADLVATAIEREATDNGNRRKLEQPPAALRRHLFVVFDGSSGSFFNSAQRGLRGRLPELPPSITTAWAGAGGHVMVTTPPQPWELHALPEEVFTEPERWLV